MKNQTEIERVHDLMASRAGEVAAYMRDNFKAGLYIGKLTALGWVVGGMPGADLAIEHDYESWVRDHDDET